MTGEIRAGRFRRARGAARGLIRTRRRAAVTGAVVLALAAGLGTWAFQGPLDIKDRYCWGGWEEDSGPAILGDDGFTGEDGHSRTSKGAAPTPDKPAGTCTLAVRSSHTFSDGDTGVQDTTVTVTYGRAPKGAADRLEWLVGYLGDGAMPLPDGLPGAVDADRGLIVLPKRCDTRDGRPVAVTLDARERSEPDEALPRTVDLGGSRTVAELLVAAANQGMEKAGCAPAEPLRVTSPLLTLPEKRETFYSDPACRIKGLDLDLGDEAESDTDYQVGPVTRDMQSCSVRIGRDDVQFLDALMVAQPRVDALIADVTGEKPPARGWRGKGVIGAGHQVVRAQCAGRPTTFLMLGSPQREATGHFAAFSNAVAQRLGCPAVAPTTSSEAGGTH
ncbi:hypothetical protein OG453_31060 [Streptomyces sp. NBC_01381]|uniref:hypothetical protein n=1 Tax=Streptomyces sp. NBC_01381 TaxID=2903845 RepID=UPI002256FC2D|nr:hypothetical protein [Streptomyces sp. NBC_01381]MCX4671084.1 hypothetical protein [Streptomyces sp. NBC_01381]